MFHIKISLSFIQNCADFLFFAFKNLVWIWSKLFIWSINIFITKFKFTFICRFLRFITNLIPHYFWRFLKFVNVLWNLVLKVQIWKIVFSIGWLSWIEDRLHYWFLGPQTDKIVPEWPWAIAPRHQSLIKLIYLFRVKTWDRAPR